MRIRPFVARDAASLAALCHAAVHAIGARHYSPAQLAAWSPAPRPAAAYVARAAGRVVLVAVDERDDGVGYVDLEPDGHIDHLYVWPDRAGRGIGSALCAAIEAAAREEGIVRLHVEASEAARPVFERRGFRLERRRDFTIRGVAIHNYAMTKPLGG